jgi:hypothetical protein
VAAAWHGKGVLDPGLRRDDEVRAGVDSRLRWIDGGGSSGFPPARE